MAQNINPFGSKKCKLQFVGRSGFDELNSLELILSAAKPLISQFGLASPAFLDDQAEPNTNSWG